MRWRGRIVIVHARINSKTPQPGDGLRFVVQLHRARRLHYDLRLEVDGRLVSWAVPKGPTLDPTVKRLAIRVDDHALDYFDFEGVLPAGQYGAGDVTIWDWGTWTPSAGTNPADALAGGALHADLSGEKLSGRFVLLHTNRSHAGSSNQWLLIHKRDASASEGWDASQFPHSVKSGKTNDEILADHRVATE